MAVCEVLRVAMPGGARDLVRMIPAEEDPNSGVSEVRGSKARSAKC
jgi:hypothetical protein